MVCLCQPVGCGLQGWLSVSTMWPVSRYHCDGWYSPWGAENFPAMDKFYATERRKTWQWSAWWEISEKNFKLCGNIWYSLTLWLHWMIWFRFNLRVGLSGQYTHANMCMWYKLIVAFVGRGVSSAGDLACVVVVAAVVHWYLRGLARWVDDGPVTLALPSCHFRFRGWVEPSVE